MSFDLAIVLIVALFGALGAFSGAIRQFAHWVGLVFAYLAARPLAAALAPSLAASWSLPPAAVKIGLATLGFFPLYFVAAFALSKVLHKLAGAAQLGKLDRLGGFLMGALKGAVLVYFPLALWLFVEGWLAQSPLAATLGSSLQPPKSALVDWTRRHNLLSSVSMPALANAQKLLEAAKDPASAQALLGDPKLRELLDDSGLKSALKDDAIVKAFESGDLESLQKDPRIAALLKDPRIAGQLPDLEGALKAVSEKPAEQ